MQHSIAAKYAARPAAHFVRPSSRVRERRMGLRSASSFRASSARQTVLRRADLSPLVQLRARWRAVTPAATMRTTQGSLRPVVTMHWGRTGAAPAIRHASAASTPWHA